MLRNARSCLTLQKITEDLGIIVSDDLKQFSQRAVAAARAMAIIGQVKRNFKRLDLDEFLLII